MKSANEESRENASQTYVPTNEELKCAEVIENRFPDGDHLIAVAARLVKIMTGRPQSDIDGFIHMVLRDHNKLEMAALTQVLNDKLPGDERKDWWKRWLAARLAHIDKYLKAYQQETDMLKDVLDESIRNGAGTNDKVCDFVPRIKGH